MGKDNNINRFDTDVACDVGVYAAIVYYDICYWNAINKRNGRGAGMYSTIKDFANRLPYLSYSQVRRALDRLRESGYINSKTELVNRYFVTDNTLTDSVLSNMTEVVKYDNHFVKYGNHFVKYDKIKKDKEKDKEKDMVVVDNKARDEKEKLVEEIKTSEIKIQGAMKSLGIASRTQFMLLSDEVLNEWEVTEEKDWSWRHLLNHMRIKNKSYEKDRRDRIEPQARPTADERHRQYQSYLLSED